MISIHTGNEYFTKKLAALVVDGPVVLRGPGDRREYGTDCNRSSSGAPSLSVTKPYFESGAR
jgi:hypothetical protein